MVPTSTHPATGGGRGALLWHGKQKILGGGGGVVLYDIDITGALSVHFLSPLTPTHKYMFMGQ